MTGGEILGYFKNREYRGFVGGCRLPEAEWGPLSPILAFSHVTSNRKVKFSFWALR